MTATLGYRDKIAVLDLGDNENRFSLDWLDAVNGHLDDAEQNADAMVTTATGKFYSNGLDLEWLMAHGDQFSTYVGRVQALLSRVLTFPRPTVAAINGHAFGAGAMLGVAHDFRVMRSDRGYFCFPEVDIKIPFTPGMAALIQAKLTPQTAVKAMTTGHRYAGEDALAAGFVDRTASEEAVLDTAIDLVAAIGAKDSNTLRAIKATMYTTAVGALTQSLG